MRLGRFAAEYARPEPAKFAWPVVVLPELFTNTRHVAVLLGYLATVGWEAYAVDLRSAAGGATPPLARRGIADLVALAGEAIDALGRETIVLGHGLGGLIALKLAERTGVKAAVAYAPTLPGWSSPLLGGVANRLSWWFRRPLAPPRRRLLYEFIADSEPFMRDTLIRALVPDTSDAMHEIGRGEIDFKSTPPAAPRLVVIGDSDPFAPQERTMSFANSIGAKCAVVPRRGHWLINGGGLERAIGETQRFLVRALGQDLLLFYEEPKPETDDT